MRRGQQGLASRSPLARLRADELYMERRKQNVQNYGSSWIKPPGVIKSLHQLREEKRELEEHQEALRREQLAQELADAEGANELLQGETLDGEVEERDLDDDIPEADISGIDPGETGSEDGLDPDEASRASMAQRIPDDMYREALVRGNESGNHGYRSERGLASDDEDGSQMLQEDDLLHDQEHDDNADLDMDMDMDMDADLDSGVPESALGGYEHTDTEEELTSSSNESESTSLPFGRTVNDGFFRNNEPRGSQGPGSFGPGAVDSDVGNGFLHGMDDEGSHNSS